MYGHIIDDVLQQTSQLRSFDFCHVNWNRNKVADNITIIHKFPGMLDGQG